MGGVFYGGTHFPHRGDDQPQQQRSPRLPGHPSGGCHAPGGCGDRQQNRHVPAHESILDFEGTGQGTATEYHEDVEDVAAHDVAHRQGIGALQHRAEADEQLGRTGTKGDHGETDHQLGDAAEDGNRHRPPHELISAQKKQADANQNLN